MSLLADSIEVSRARREWNRFLGWVIGYESITESCNVWESSGIAWLNAEIRESREET